jgi:hypothetical protein
MERLPNRRSDEPVNQAGRSPSFDHYRHTSDRHRHRASGAHRRHAAATRPATPACAVPARVRPDQSSCYGIGVRHAVPARQDLPIKRAGFAAVAGQHLDGDCSAASAAVPARAVLLTMALGMNRDAERRMVSAMLAQLGSTGPRPYDGEGSGVRAGEAPVSVYRVLIDGVPRPRILLWPATTRQHRRAAADLDDIPSAHASVAPNVRDGSVNLHSLPPCQTPPRGRTVRCER